MARALVGHCTTTTLWGGSRRSRGNYSIVVSPAQRSYFPIFLVPATGRMRDTQIISFLQPSLPLYNIKTTTRSFATPSVKRRGRFAKRTRNGIVKARRRIEGERRRDRGIAVAAARAATTARAPPRDPGGNLPPSKGSPSPGRRAHAEREFSMLQVELYLANHPSTCINEIN